MLKLILRRLFREDRGAIGILDLVVATMIIGILTVALMSIVGSAFSTTAAVESRSEFFSQRAELSDELRTLLTGAAPSGGCLDRVNPAAALSTSNCQHFTSGSAVLVAGTATRLCSLVGAPEGLQTTATPPSEPVVLLPSEQVCIEATQSGDVLVTRRPADPSTEYVNATWTADIPQGERLSALADELVFTYYDVNGQIVVPSDNGALSALQLSTVRRVMCNAALKSANGRISESITVVVAVGAGRFVDEQSWQGR